MTRLSVSEELESAADRIAYIARALRVVLCRAASMLGLRPAAGASHRRHARFHRCRDGNRRSDLIQIVLREWLETNAYQPVRAIDEESETDGSR